MRTTNWNVLTAAQPMFQQLPMSNDIVASMTSARWQLTSLALSAVRIFYYSQQRSSADANFLVCWCVQIIEIQKRRRGGSANLHQRRRRSTKERHETRDRAVYFIMRGLRRRRRRCVNAAWRKMGPDMQIAFGEVSACLILTNGLKGCVGRRAPKRGCGALHSSRRSAALRRYGGGGRRSRAGHP